MDLSTLNANADAAEALLKVLASRYRLMLLCELHKGEKSVTALQQMVGLSQSAVSQHLARLRDEGLVSTRREAQTIYYTLASENAARIIATLYDIYCIRD